MLVYLWSNNFEHEWCYHFALTIMCLCMEKAAFPGKEDQENQELLRKAPKPVTSR